MPGNEILKVFGLFGGLLFKNLFIIYAPNNRVPLPMQLCQNWPLSLFILFFHIWVLKWQILSIYFSLKLHCLWSCFLLKSHATESVGNCFDSKSNQKRDIAESWICRCVKEPIIVILDVHSFIYAFVFLYYHLTNIYCVRSLFLRAENT